MNLQLATEEDIFQISQLYFDVYQGTYPDPLMKDFGLIRQFIQSEAGFWFVTKDNGKIIASVLTAYDKENLIAKAFGAVVRNEYRQRGIMEELLAYGIKYLREKTGGVDVIYSTTRTVNEAAQTLTEKLGFKKLGIFPNAHRTNDYETHCLAAIVYPEALEKRNKSYMIHHEVASLYDIVQNEVGMGALETIIPDKPSKVLVEPGDLEVVKSPKFVNYRYQHLKNEKQLEFEFFPFHQPNLVILTPDQSVELFCHLSSVDGYCVIVGGKMPGNLNFTDLFLRSNKLLRDAGARYIEVIARADRPKILESILRAKFIPCGLFPAFQKVGDRRHDFVVFSRSFEIFDFQNVRLKGLNQVYLEEYFNAWKRMSLNPKLLNL
ncbi:GNAT family N-acetyltransferase [Peredibacter starrii]|uniref:GNAT family N-acetyltransferase n=1 Tax=Peredibacter starrii TaxID=28202 RepID=A0AAX4HN64_9BACT|nr:GNAT family N-acetyltransferase [Peredibacter starrii]WPU64762.1 GNAT family N-acetyltransferase [Peredibacter starrii]